MNTVQSVSVFTELLKNVRFVVTGNIIFYPEFPIAAIRKFLLNNRFEAVATLDQNFRLENNKMLLSDIRENGVERRVEAFLHKGEVVLYDGHRRLWASRKSDFKTIPLALHKDMTYARASVLAVTKNLEGADKTKRYLQVSEQAVAFAKMVDGHGGKVSKALHSFLKDLHPDKSAAELKRMEYLQLSEFSRMATLGRTRYSIDLLCKEMISKVSAYLFASLEIAKPETMKLISEMIRSYCSKHKDRGLPVSLAQEIYEHARSGGDVSSFFSKIRSKISRKGPRKTKVCKAFIDGRGKVHSARVSYYGLTFTSGDNKKSIIGSAGNILKRRIREERQDYRAFVEAVNKL